MPTTYTPPKTTTRYKFDNSFRYALHGFFFDAEESDEVLKDKMLTAFQEALNNHIKYLYDAYIRFGLRGLEYAYYMAKNYVCFEYTHHFFYCYAAKVEDIKVPYKQWVVNLAQFYYEKMSKEESALGLNEDSSEEAREAAVPEQWKWEGNLEELFNKSFGGENEKRDGYSESLDSVLAQTRKVAKEADDKTWVCPTCGTVHDKVHLTREEMRCS